ncbi:PAS domain S-box protein [Rubrivivax sp. JA1029]|uniref:PAS domain S-box protein n=1 Tax=Rubrivivax sp. JA1029 TaxID=2894193 RepID=UPI001E50E1B2|nr:PAS domain S-box protein [Rubrivivax sp. JA1029]MCC9648447.1 PAS domain S-box protein [Rubrivivax sp. JA1029]
MHAAAAPGAARRLDLRSWRRPLLAAALTLALALAGATLAWQQQARQNAAEADAAFTKLAERVAVEIHKRMDRYEYGLRAARGAYAAAGAQAMRRADFRRHSLTWDLAREFPGTRGFGIVRRVAEDEVPGFVAAQRRDGWPDYQVQSLALHSGELYLIQFFEPVELNRVALGLDIASEPRRLDAAVSAMRSGQVTISAPVTLLQEPARRARSFLMLLPIYPAGADVSTPQRREAAALGWAYTPLVIDEVLADLPDSSLFGLRIDDGDLTQDEGFYDSIAGQRGDGLPRHALRLAMFGREWQLQLQARQTFVDGLKQPSPRAEFLEVLLLGSVCATLAAVLTRLLHRGRSQRLEQARRAAIVEDSNDAIIVQTLDGTITDWNSGAERLFGYTAAQVLGHRATELLVPPDREAEDHGLLATVARGDRVKVFETERRHRDGTLIEVSITASPIRGPDGRCVGSAKTIRDVRDARAAERRVRELNATLEDQVRERTALLEAARHDLQMVLDATSSMIGYWDSGLRNRVANRAYGDWFGIEPERVHGMPMHEVLGQALYEQNLPRIQSALAGESCRFEITTPPMAHRGARHALVQYVPDVDADGGVRGFYSFVHDVTELNESRLRLAAAQRDNAALLQTLDRHAIVSVADRAGRIVEVNEAFCRVSGYRADELIGQNHRIVNSGQHDSTFWTGMWRTIASGHSWHGEVCNRAKDGSLYWVDSVIAPFLDAEGRVEKYVSIRTDISDRKRAEQALQRTLTLLRTVLEASTQVSIVATGADGRVNVFNKGSELLLGWSAAEAGSAPQAPDFVELDDGRAVDAGTGFAAIAARSGQAPGERVYRRRDGSRVPVSLAVTPMLDAAGAPAGYLGIAHDISARQRQERSLHEAMQQARQANRAKSQFLANMSHEIRTPLNAVIGLAYLLGRTPLQGEQADMLGRIQLASNALLALINDVLDLSKIEAGEMALERVPFDLGRLVRDVAALMGLQAQQKGIEFVVDTGGPLPPGVEGDSTRLRQVLINLVGNAIKFTERGSVRLLLRHRLSAPGRLQVEFAVEDTGIGIPQAAQAGLFEPFVQADASTTRRFGGTGLGLSIVRQLVALMDGTLTLDSEPGRGSRFGVVLDLPVVDSMEAPAEESDVAGSGLEGLRVLVVDDSSVNQDVARRLLEGEGARVQLAGNGLQAVERLEAGPADFDIVLMDVQMPVLDGLDATRRIRGVLGLDTLPIVGLTAGVSRSEQARARAAGMNEVIGKPFDPPALVAALRRVVWGTTSAPPAAPAALVPLPPDWPSIDGVDAAAACRRLRGDTGLLRTMLKRIVEHADVLSQIARDPTTARARLHDLKGLAGTIGAEALQRAASSAEHACRRLVDAEEADQPPAGSLPPAELEALIDAVAGEAARLRAAAAAFIDAVPARAASARPLQAGELAELLALLAQGDLSAVERVESLAGTLSAALGDTGFSALEREVQNLEFEAAAALLAGLVPSED